MNQPVNQSTVTVRDLHQSYGRKRILRGVDLDLAPGTVTALAGRNGEGKSTLIHCLMGRVRCRATTLSVLGHDPRRDPRAILGEVGYVPDVPDVESWMRLDRLGRTLAAWNRAFDETLYRKLLEEYQLDQRARIGTLSRGQGMKAMLASALALQPKLLLLDEPFGGLDAIATDEVLSAILSRGQDADRSVLVITHDLTMVSRIADRVLLLEDGRLRELEHDEGEGMLRPERLKLALERVGEPS